MQPCRGPERLVWMMTNATNSRASPGASVLFDVWLQTDLQRLYDKMLMEPVPEELLRLVLPPQELDAE